MVRGYSAGKVKQMLAARKAVKRASNALRGRSTTNLRAPLRTGGWYGTYNRRGRDELKFIDTQIAAGALAATGPPILLNGVTQGTDWNNRIGRTFQMKSILFRFAIRPNPASAASNSTLGPMVRVCVVYDSQANSLLAAKSDIFQSAADYKSPLNLANRDRFRILIDKTLTMSSYTMTAGSLTAGDPRGSYMDVFRKVNLEVVNSGTSNVIGSIQTGALLLCTITETNDYVQAEAYVRVRFSDK